MALVTISDGRIGFGESVLVDGISAAIHPGGRIGLVGPNGCGKTSLLRAVCGELALDKGRIDLRRGLSAGFLRQTADGSENESKTLMAEMELAMKEVDDLELRIGGLSARLAEAGLSESERTELVAKLGGAEHRFNLLGGYNRDYQIERVLCGVGFSKNDFFQPLGTMSGGQRQKAGLAKLLLSRPELLLLDEPNNHLDLDGRKFLEEFLVSSGCAVLAASHDRYFLNRVAEYIWEIDAEKLYLYRGNYDAFLRARLERIERQRGEYKAQREYIERTEEYIRRNIAGQNTRQARGRRKHLARLERIEGVKEKEALKLKLAPAQRTGEEVLRIQDLSHAYGNKKLFSKLSFVLRRGEKLGIIGPNGCGKTTLVKIAAGIIRPDSGRAAYGAQVEKAYLPQETNPANPERTVLEEYSRACGLIDNPAARSGLAKFLFTGEDVFKKTGALSGGEIRRLELAKMLFRTPNFLILDEPTNHFDIASCEMLESALRDFPGAVLFASHDRALLDAVSTHIITFTKDGIFLCEGGYADWLDAERGISPETKVESVAAREGGGTPIPSREIEASKPRRRSEEFERKREAEKLVKKMAAAETELEVYESELAALLGELEKPEVATNGARLAEISERMEELNRIIEKGYEEVGALDAELAVLETGN